MVKFKCWRYCHLSNEYCFKFSICILWDWPSFGLGWFNKKGKSNSRQWVFSFAVSNCVNTSSRLEIGNLIGHISHLKMLLKCRFHISDKVFKYLSPKSPPPLSWDFTLCDKALKLTNYPEGGDVWYFSPVQLVHPSFWDTVSHYNLVLLI